MSDAKTLGAMRVYPDDVNQGQTGITLRQHFAGLVDVSVYSPRATFELKFNRQPTVDELAEYIASIRVIEADALLAELAKGDKP